MFLHMNAGCTLTQSQIKTHTLTSRPTKPYFNMLSYGFIQVVQLYHTSISFNTFSKKPIQNHVRKTSKENQLKFSL
jgi:hypothetical protein